jgi:hypothetical protein
VHTPGPWRVGGEYAPQFVNELPTVRTHDGKHIAYVYTESPDDARLIAAAPELLEALRDLLRDEAICDDDSETLIATRNRAYTAVAKAEGK